MMMFFQTVDGIGGNGARAFQCAACGSLVTHSDRLLGFNGRNRHLFVNPAGVECDFHTFFSCPGAVALGEGTEEHTWFSGYAWRMAFCRNCFQHLGWFYEGVSGTERPREFWGILLVRIMTARADPRP